MFVEEHVIEACVLAVPDDVGLAIDVYDFGLVVLEVDGGVVGKLLDVELEMGEDGEDVLVVLLCRCFEVGGEVDEDYGGDDEFEVDDFVVDCLWRFVESIRSDEIFQILHYYEQFVHNSQ